MYGIAAPITCLNKYGIIYTQMKLWSTIYVLKFSFDKTALDWIDLFF